MPNVFTPSGFTPVRRVDGAAWTANVTQYKIAANNSHSFFQGDPVIRLATGYIDGGAGINPAALPANGIVGIFMGCERLSTATGSKVWSNRFTGDANADVDVWVVDDPYVVYRVWVGTGASSAAGGPVVLADVGNNINFQVGTGNTFSGISGSYVDYATKATTVSLPFTIIGQVTQPPGLNGTDITTAGNLIEVTMNLSQYRAGVTGV